MKTLPVLFSTPMVQPTLKNIKTQTRRTQGLESLNVNPNDWIFKERIGSHFIFSCKGVEKWTLGPKFLEGDILWVRETWHKIFDAETNVFLKYGYKADWSEGIISHPKNKGIWNPSIHMPKKAARIFLKVTNVRVERLQCISEEDAIAEGIEIVGYTGNGFPIYKEYFLKDVRGCFAPENSFRSLWKKINGEKSWISNPWVWVYEFEKTEKPLNFLKN